jgi:hypothetical protein
MDADIGAAIERNDTVAVMFAAKGQQVNRKT